MSQMRRSIHYWKCDRPAALHGVKRTANEAPEIPASLGELLSEALSGEIQLQLAGGKGNHRTFHFHLEGKHGFVRLEDGPEGDENLRVESRILEEVARVGIPAPQAWFTDVSRSQVPFAVQVIEYLDWPDLGSLHREGELVLTEIAQQIGQAVATWQSVPVSGFGPFNPEALETTGRLVGWHDDYATYFELHLDRHLSRLEAAGFLSAEESAHVVGVIAEHRSLLELSDGCLVHKDLALWNMLGTSQKIQAFIDWDDAIAGDPSDDLSLLACFYSGEILQAATAAYTEVRSLPEEFLRRFWLHLIRNLIVKAVIRSEAGYFKQGAGTVFLMGAAQDGAALRQFTRDRLFLACRGLAGSRPLEDLNEH